MICLSEELWKTVSDIKQDIADDVWNSVKQQTDLVVRDWKMNVVSNVIPHYKVTHWIEDGETSMFMPNEDIYRTKEEAEAAKEDRGSWEPNPNGIMISIATKAAKKVVKKKTKKAAKKKVVKKKTKRPR